MAKGKFSKKPELTGFGKYLTKRSVNKSEICRKVGISLTRLNRLCNDKKSFLRSYELELIAKAMKIVPANMQEELFGHLQLNEDQDVSEQEKLALKVADSLTANGLLEKYKLKDEDIRRIVETLKYCLVEKEEGEILEHIELKRKSANFSASLKACEETEWLKVNKSHQHEKEIRKYTTTEKGKEIITIEPER